MYERIGRPSLDHTEEAGFVTGRVIFLRFAVIINMVRMGWRTVKVGVTSARIKQPWEKPWQGLIYFPAYLPPYGVLGSCLPT